MPRAVSARKGERSRAPMPVKSGAQKAASARADKGSKPNGSGRAVATARFVNQGDRAIPALPVTLEIDGRRVEAKSAALEPHGTATVRFTVDGDGPRKLIVFFTTTHGRRDPLYLLVAEPELDPPTAGTDHVGQGGVR